MNDALSMNGAEAALASTTQRLPFHRPLHQLHGGENCVERARAEGSVNGMGGEQH
jgi:hypothetical protein